MKKIILLIILSISVNTNSKITIKNDRVHSYYIRIINAPCHNVLLHIKPFEIKQIDLKNFENIYRVKSKLIKEKCDLSKASILIKHKGDKKIIPIKDGATYSIIGEKYTTIIEE